MNKLLLQKRQEFEAKQKALAAIFAEAGDEMDMDKVKSLPGQQGGWTSMQKVEKIRELNKELNALGVEVESLASLGNVAEEQKAREELLKKGIALPHPGGSPEWKSFGQLFVASKAYTDRGRNGGPEAELDVEMKTLFETGAGWAAESLRTGRVVEKAERPIQLIDLIPPGRTTMAAIKYMEETTFTNAAAEKAEGVTYPEAALALTERTESVRKIAVFIPVTDEQLEDVEQAQSYLNQRLPFMLRQRLDGQIINGDGVAPNLKGILNVAGIQTQAKGTDPVPDAIHKAMTKVQVTGRAFPNAVILHPNDWEELRLLRTADGIYIWGSPSEAVAPRVWGLPVVLADSIADGTGLVGDFANFSQLFERRGITVKVSDSHGTFFVEGKMAVRADVRMAMITYRPAAFSKVTGI